MNNETTKTDVTVFTNEDFGDLRVIIIDGETWFMATDVCKILGLKNPTKSLKGLKENEYSNFKLGNSGKPGNPNVLFVNEPGLYRLIFRSRKPEAEKFQDWVYHEVLPAIRKTGGYSLNGKNPEELASELTELAKISSPKLRDELVKIVANMKLGYKAFLAQDFDVTPSFNNLKDFMRYFLDANFEFDDRHVVTQEYFIRAFRSEYPQYLPDVSDEIITKCLSQFGIFLREYVTLKKAEPCYYGLKYSIKAL